MTDIFVSYSRQDGAFVKRLCTALEELDVTAWVDWQGIPPTADWMAQIHHAIEAADTFIFVITPASANSSICTSEIAHAVSNNKRLIPLLHVDTPTHEVPPDIARLHWIFFREQDDFSGAVRTLEQALKTDLAHVRFHTRLLTRTVEWEEKQRERSLLLRGRELREAENWRTQSAQPPQPTPAQLSFIAASRKADKLRKSWMAGTAVLLLTGIIFAVWYTGSQQRQINLELADKLAEASDNESGDLGTLLAIEAVRLSNEAAGIPSVRSVSALNSPNSSSDILRLIPRSSRGDVDILGLRFGAEGNSLFGVARNTDLLRRWDLCLTNPEKPLCDDEPNIEVIAKADKKPNSISLSPDTNWLVYNHDQLITVRQLSAGSVEQYETEGRPDEPFIDSSKRWLVVPQDRNRYIQVFKLGQPEQKFLHRAPDDQAFTDVAIHPVDGKALLATTAGVVYATPPDQPEDRMPVLESRIRRLAISPEGKSIAAVGADSRLWLYRYVDGAILEPLGELKHRLGGSNHPILAFNGDGSMLAFYVKPGNKLHTIALWRFNTGERQPTPMEFSFDHGTDNPNHFVTSIAFSPDNGWVAAALGYGENDVLIWPLTARALIAHGCGRVGGNMSAQQWDRYMPGVDYRKTCEDMQATK